MGMAKANGIRTIKATVLIFQSRAREPAEREARTLIWPSGVQAGCWRGTKRVALFTITRPSAIKNRPKTEKDMPLSRFGDAGRRGIVAWSIISTIEGCGRPE